MKTQAGARRRYDHRIREAVVEGRERLLARDLDIPPSTRRSWIRRGAPPVIAIAPAAPDGSSLATRVAHLERQVGRLRAIARLLVALVTVMDARLEGRRLPQGDAKAKLLRAIGNAEDVLGPRVALRLVGLHEERLRSWKRRELACRLDDAPPCPRTSPGRLTREERGAIRDLVESESYRHFSIRSLALLAQRAGRVFASYGTWCSLIRRYGWARRRQRVYPATTKTGVRASAPNEWWHVDVTIIRLLDGSRAYVHAVLDNYSRKVLSWAIEPELRAATTRTIVLAAPEPLASGARVRVMTDGGSENVIIGADSDLSAVATHVVAQVGIHFSNSMIEALWRVLRHQWLYMHSLDSITTLRRLVTDYVHEHNAVIPRIELGGRTPDEAYAGRELDLRERLTAAHADARRARVAANRAVSCAACPAPPPACGSVP